MLDPILAEIRRVRDALSDEFDGDITAILSDLDQSAARAGRVTVQLPPKPYARQSANDEKTSRPEAAAPQLGIEVFSGQECPASGIWRVVGSQTTTLPVERGNSMPPYEGKSVTWKLIQDA